MDKKIMFKKRNFLWRTFNFSGYISAGNFWSDLAVRLISFFCAMIVMCIVISAVVPGDTEQIIALCESLVPVLALVWGAPIVPLTRRRLRDAGYSAKSYFWLLIPGIGLIAFVARLCGKSVARQPGEIWFE